MINWVVIIIQNHPYTSEFFHSIHETRESAEIAAEDLETSLPEHFSVDIESSEVLNLEKEQNE